jgi:hypothetical protein
MSYCILGPAYTSIVTQKFNITELQTYYSPEQRTIRTLPENITVTVTITTTVATTRTMTTTTIIIIYLFTF